jgi:hypothetical protein
MSTSPRIPARVIPTFNGEDGGEFVPATSFQAITWFDTGEGKQIIILYALGEDGIVYEFTNREWKPYPIKK